LDYLGMIKRQALIKKLRTFSILMVIMAIFSAYFTACYLIAIDNYKVTAESVYNLHIMLFKDSCLENLVCF
jgi:hypothetical protein